MDSFIRIITSENIDTDLILEHVSNYAQVDYDNIIIGDMDSDHLVYHIPIQKHLTESESNEFMHRAVTLFENTCMQDVDVEFSTGMPISVLTESDIAAEPEEVKPESYDIFTETDYDLVNDLIVYMRNDFQFYRKYYYPTLHNIAKQYKKTGKIDASKLRQMIKTGTQTYCATYNTPEEPNELFGADELSEVYNRIVRDEIKEIRNGEYA